MWKCLGFFKLGKNLIIKICKLTFRADISMKILNLICREEQPWRKKLIWSWNHYVVLLIQFRVSLLYVLEKCNWFPNGIRQIYSYVEQQGGWENKPVSQSIYNASDGRGNISVHRTPLHYICRLLNRPGHRGADLNLDKKGTQTQCIDSWWGI